MKDLYIIRAHFLGAFDNLSGILLLSFGKVVGGGEGILFVI